MGISVQASGIKVEKNKYYLVNLNADPSLNELLVYYLKVLVLPTRSSISRISAGPEVVNRLPRPTKSVRFSLLSVTNYPPLLFQDRTLVGADSSADIQLSGLGIQPQHCLLLVEGGGLYLEPLGSARCFVNGTPVVSRVRLGHADRVLWGNHHFFRVNCPKATRTEGKSTHCWARPFP